MSYVTKSFTLKCGSFAGTANQYSLNRPTVTEIRRQGKCHSCLDNVQFMKYINLTIMHCVLTN